MDAICFNFGDSLQRDSVLLHTQHHVQFNSFWVRFSVEIYGNGALLGYFGNNVITEVVQFFL